MASLLDLVIQTNVCLSIPICEHNFYLVEVEKCKIIKCKRCIIDYKQCQILSNKLCERCNKEKKRLKDKIYHLIWVNKKLLNYLPKELIYLICKEILR